MVDTRMGTAADTTADVESEEEKRNRAEEMFKLAQSLHKGKDSLEVDLSRAVHLYQCALDKGYMAARGPLLEILAATPAAKGASTDDYDGEDGNDYDYGAGMMEEAASLEQSNLEKAKELYYNVIHEYENPEAMNALAILLEKSDAPRSVILYTRAIKEHKHCDAMFNLAVLLVKGADGVEVNAVRAMRLFEEVIKHEGDTDAMKKLAELLQVGAEGVPQDKKRAELLFNEAKSIANEIMDVDNDRNEDGTANKEMAVENK